MQPLLSWRGGLSGQSMAGLSGWPDYPAPGRIIRPPIWLTPTLVLSRISEAVEGGADYPPPWPEYPDPILGDADASP
jgi:hypothetical protein